MSGCRSAHAAEPPITAARKTNARSANTPASETMGGNLARDGPTPSRVLPLPADWVRPVRRWGEDGRRTAKGRAPRNDGTVEAQARRARDGAADQGAGTAPRASRGAARGGARRG